MKRQLVVTETFDIVPETDNCYGCFFQNNDYCADHDCRGERVIFELSQCNTNVVEIED